MVRLESLSSLPDPHVNVVPELQGTTQEVALEKCRHAAKLVSPALVPNTMSV
jgi:hypothetical protein